MNRDDGHLPDGIPSDGSSRASGFHRPNGGGHPIPDDVRDVARMLEARGARHRTTLSRESLERIVAASDLQLPVADATPIAVVRAGRRMPVSEARSSGRLRLASLRIAAAIAIVGGIGFAGYAVARAILSSTEPRGTERLMAGGPTGSSSTPDVMETPSGSDAGSDVGVGARRSQANPSPAHVESVLAGEFRAGDLFAGGLFAGHLDVEGSNAGGRRGFASGVRVRPVADAEAADATLGGLGIAGLLEPDVLEGTAGGMLMDGADATFDELSAEFASVCALAGVPAGAATGSR